MTQYPRLKLLPPGGLVRRHFFGTLTLGFALLVNGAFYLAIRGSSFATLHSHAQASDSPIAATPSGEQSHFLLSELRGSGGAARFNHELRNISDTDLRLVFKGVSCGCIGMFVGDRQLAPGQVLTIPPGGELDVSLRLDVRGPSSTQQTLEGSFQIIGPNNEDHGLTTITSIANIFADVESSPDVLACDFAAGSSPVEKKLRVRRYFRGRAGDAREPRLTGLPPLIKVRGVGPPERPLEAAPGIWRQDWPVTLTCLPPRSPSEDRLVGHFYAEFIEPNTMTPASASVSYQVRRAFGVVAPDFLYFARVRAGESMEKKFVIESADDRPFSVLGADSSSDSFVPALRDVGSEKRHWVTVQCRPVVGGQPDGLITLRTDHPDCPELEVRVSHLGTKQ